MKIGIIISSGDGETVWNAFRFANFAREKGDEVRVFLIGKGVECESLDSEKFPIKEQMQRFLDRGGEIFACGTCLKIRNMEGSERCPLSTLGKMYEIVKESDRLLIF